MKSKLQVWETLSIEFRVVGIEWSKLFVSLGNGKKTGKDKKVGEEEWGRAVDCVWYTTFLCWACTSNTRPWLASQCSLLLPLYRCCCKTSHIMRRLFKARKKMPCWAQWQVVWLIAVCNVGKPGNALHHYDKIRFVPGNFILIIYSFLPCYSKTNSKVWNAKHEIALVYKYGERKKSTLQSK